MSGSFAVGSLHALRNRVAHHEPLLHEDLPARYADVVDIAGRLHPQLAEHLAATSLVPLLLGTRP